MKEVRIQTDYITLGQFLKLADAVDGGGQAKMVILNGEVQVNGETETRRGRKLYNGDQIHYAGISYQVVK